MTIAASSRSTCPFHRVVRTGWHPTSATTSTSVATVGVRLRRRSRSPSERPMSTVSEPSDSRVISTMSRPSGSSDGPANSRAANGG